MKEDTMRKSIVIAALTLSSAFAQPVVAEVAPAEVATVEVKVADLDLTSAAGAEVLENRIEDAAEKVCAKPDVRNLKAMQAFELCQAGAVDAAFEQLSVANPFDGIELASNF
jgi:UrcA family protein